MSSTADRVAKPLEIYCQIQDLCFSSNYDELDGILKSRTDYEPNKVLNILLDSLKTVGSDHSMSSFSCSSVSTPRIEHSKLVKPLISYLLDTKLATPDLKSVTAAFERHNDLIFELIVAKYKQEYQKRGQKHYIHGIADLSSDVPVAKPPRSSMLRRPITLPSNIERIMRYYASKGYRVENKIKLPKSNLSILKLSLMEESILNDANELNF